jgi:hypothetical protein
MSKLTVEQVYDAIHNDVAVKEPGDIYYDWLFVQVPGIILNNRQKYNIYCKSRHFDQLKYDMIIYHKSKHVLENIDHDSDDSDSEEPDWFEINTFEELFFYEWKVKPRLEMIIDMIQIEKDSIIECDYETYYFHVTHYNALLLFLKEWIKHSGVAIKSYLIDELPLCKDVKEIIKKI